MLILVTPSFRRGQILVFIDADGVASLPPAALIRRTSSTGTEGRSVHHQGESGEEGLDPFHDVEVQGLAPLKLVGP